MLCDQQSADCQLRHRVSSNSLNPSTQTAEFQDLGIAFLCSLPVSKMTLHMLCGMFLAATAFDVKSKVASAVNLAQSSMGFGGVMVNSLRFCAKECFNNVSKLAFEVQLSKLVVPFLTGQNPDHCDHLSAPDPGASLCCRAHAAELVVSLCCRAGCSRIGSGEARCHKRWVRSPTCPS